jgi:hypothetical protein
VVPWRDSFLRVNIRKSGFCYISSYSTIYANIVSIVPIVSKGNPPSIGAIIVLYITYSSTLTINANIVDLKWGHKILWDITLVVSKWL